MARPKSTKFKVATDENAVGPAIARSKSVNMASSRLNIDKGKAGLAPAVRNPTAGSRAALGEIHNVRKKVCISFLIATLCGFGGMSGVSDWEYLVPFSVVSVDLYRH